MCSLHQKISVPFDYPVYFTEHVFSPDNAILAEAISRREPNRKHRIFVVVDEGVHKAWPNLNKMIDNYVATFADRLELAAPPEILPGGEEVKNNTESLMDLLKCLHDLALDRQSLLVIVGGGAVQDMAGFAAAITHRGLRVVRIPTTVLSQNDSGVGVKNGINAFGSKNFLGAFAPPFAVICDLRFIDTLDPRDLIAGQAEAVKVSLIRDLEFFHWLEANTKKLRAFENDAMGYMIRRGGEIHLQHIATSGDPFEFGSARPLDFGHWAGHKLESLTEYRLRHGEAVAIGMAIDTYYSHLVGLLDIESVERACALMENLGLKLWDDVLLEKDDAGRFRVMRGLAEFREHLGGDLTVTLLEGIGKGKEVHDIDEALALESIQWLKRRSRQ